MLLAVTLTITALTIATLAMTGHLPGFGGHSAMDGAANCVPTAEKPRRRPNRGRVAAG